jgi:hypothetical protein
MLSVVVLYVMMLSVVVPQVNLPELTLRQQALGLNHNYKTSLEQN